MAVYLAAIHAHEPHPLTGGRAGGRAPSDAAAGPAKSHNQRDVRSDPLAYLLVPPGLHDQAIGVGRLLGRIDHHRDDADLTPTNQDCDRRGPAMDSPSCRWARYGFGDILRACEQR